MPGTRSARPNTLLLCAVVATACGSSPEFKLDTIDPNANPFGLELIAGGVGGPGDLDGAGADARFSAPSSVAVDGAGNLYVADAGNSVIRKVSPAGQVTTLAGTPGILGGADGERGGARFQRPLGVAIGGDGTVYVADTGNSAIRTIDAQGVVDTLAGRAGTPGTTDGTAGDARFSGPVGIAVGRDGTVYVADTNNATIRKITTSGIVSTLAGTARTMGTIDGTGAAARFTRPAGLTVDSAGNLFVTDNDTMVRKITPAGVVTTIAGGPISGNADGAGKAAQFRQPAGLAVDASGTLFVADAGNNTIRQIAADGTVTTLAGMAGTPGSDDGTGAAARFGRATGVAVSGGTVFVADTFNHTIRKLAVATQAVTTLAGTAQAYGYTDGARDQARFIRPVGITNDGDGNLFISDPGDHTIRKITRYGDVSTVAGLHGVPGTVDGPISDALFDGPIGVAVDRQGSVFAADFMRHVIRRIDPAGTVSTVAGVTDKTGASDGTGKAALFNGPGIIAIDPSDNVYVADTGNNAIRKVAPGGAVTTLPNRIGTDDDPPGGDDDGSSLNVPSGVSVDAAGNVFVADTANHAIRKIAADGTVTNLAGVPGEIGHEDGDAASALFNQPFGTAVDAAGNVYVADFGNAAIRKITPAGQVSTIAGTPTSIGIVLGEAPNLAWPIALTVIGDSIAIVDSGAVLLLRHGTR